MKIWTVVLQVTDDGISDRGTGDYLDKEGLIDALRQGVSGVEFEVMEITEAPYGPSEKSNPTSSS